jgi:hypothetical protein
LGYEKSPELYEDFYRSEYDKPGKYINLISVSGMPEEIQGQTERICLLEDQVRELSEALGEAERETDSTKATSLMS